jgi:glycolate oxidase FAD binding subunit
MNHGDISAALRDQVINAANKITPLCIAGGGSKAFYGRQTSGVPVDVSGHQGIVNYEPTELVITARAGTALHTVEQALDENNQMLAFEPPAFGSAATLGGTIACNLSGPRRPYTGSARDFVLGTKILNGKGEILSFGGEVMKNVAGYDVSRLMCGAMGTLGILLDISLKVLPKPESELTLAQTVNAGQALDAVHRWARQPLPISAICFDGDTLFVRLSGAAGAIRAAREALGGDAVPSADAFWKTIREHTHPFFNSGRAVWRLSLASDTRPIVIDGDWLYEWGGAQRWLASDAPPEVIRKCAQGAGGHATLYRGGPLPTEIFHPLPEPTMNIHRRLKQAFDPKGILNRGRMYEGL